VWKRMVSCHGGTTWLLHNTFEVHTLLGLPPQIEGSMRKMEILGYDEDNRAIIVFVDGNVYMVQPMSTQFRKLYESRYPIKCHPFASFYTPGDCSSLLPWHARGRPACPSVFCSSILLCIIHVASVFFLFFCRN
jgi:hypothetical protein